MKQKVLLVAHDAGGAEILSAWYRNNLERFYFMHILGGPAEDIFLRDHSGVRCTNLDVINEFEADDFILTSTSLENDLERNAIAKARELGVRCISFLDHWDLYRERFGNEENWEGNLPDEIWVGDNYAYEYAIKEGFPRDVLKLVKNPYFEAVKAFKNDCVKTPESSRKRILYLCEPISRKLNVTFSGTVADYDNEVQILESFLKTVDQHPNEIEIITLRLHPSEEFVKYQKLVENYGDKIPLEVSTERLLHNDILKHTTIIGVESNALVVGVLLDREVYSCITGKQWEISLPHKEIKRISDFNKLFHNQE
jgi:hypothetical protein